MRQNENKKVDETTKNAQGCQDVLCQLLEIEKFNYFTAMLPSLYFIN